MANCTNCGKQIEGDPVLAILGDKPHRNWGWEPGQSNPFPLHQECFDKYKVITVPYWEGGTNDTYSEIEVERYIQWED